ncbi:uncharacterized protein LOC102801063 [Saccoglossus kowalevskii]|uniref:Uncharacterized protein LOC102801063 n=1 Tax=Saccoglossus kowalevskii TaxID=10224 RepID=A0ABM0MTK4_SACKO|nr:PREDICTED: uncharacterized protein LOC102801063 [Saccoglossus kowalevskii]
MGKSRVPSLKTAAVPRLELTAATVSVKTTPSQWYYVSSGSNPADQASRGIRVAEVKNKLFQQWFKGPQFLWQQQSNWPLQPDDLLEISANDKELKSKKSQICAMHTNTKAENDVVNLLLHRFSSWYKLQISVAWLLRYKSYLMFNSGKHKHTTIRGPITVAELSPAVNEIVKLVQKQTFPKKMANLKKQPDIDGYISPLRKLNPMLIDGILRVGGRLANAPMNVEFIQPIILPSNHHVTELVIHHYHYKEGHVGANHVLAGIHKQFWIIRGYSTVRCVTSKCITCRRWNSQPSKQIMAPLPGARVTPGDPPFSSVGIDYFGPVLVKWRRGTTKRYGCVFTCLAISAVHIEVAHELSTDSFIQAVWRFISRRGPPTDLYSDNGTNFKGTELELKQSITRWNRERIIDSFRRRNIQWHFNPPAASHAGGVWERMIRSIRKILRSLLGNKLLDDETLLTFLAEVEKILNDRPLFKTSSDPCDARPITPNDLLLLRPNPCITANPIVKDNIHNYRQLLEKMD